MKQHILPAIRLTLVCIFILVIVYPLFIWAIAQAAPGQGNGQRITFNDKTVGYKLEGQRFSEDKYFQGRPSAVDYNAGISGGSNKGTYNPDYLQQVSARIDSFLIHNPGISKADIPAELVTASGSGLDPDISPEAAYIQVSRIAGLRSIKEPALNALIKKNIQQPAFGLMGPATVNVLQLNLDLDQSAK